MTPPAAQAGQRADSPGDAPVRLCIIGGSPSHPGGLEAYCERALQAFRCHAPKAEVALFPTEAAYVNDRGLARMIRCAKALVARRGDFDLAWVHVSCLAEALFVPLARALGWTVLVTPPFRCHQSIGNARMGSPAAAGDHGAGARSGPAVRGAGRRDQPAFGSSAPCDRDVPARAGLRHAARARDRCAAASDPRRAFFSAAKGSLLMLDLCAKLKRAGIPFAARLIGRGDTEVVEEIARKIAEAKMADQVILIDWLDADGIAQALREADVLVHLSAIDSFPLIVLEALAADTLPIVRPMAGSLSMVRTCGGHATGDDQPAADAYAWLAGKDLHQLRREGREAGERARAAYGWSRIVDAALDAMHAAVLRLR
ncbi:glycosyltransferase [Novosphingobium colocasiae]